MNDKKDFTIVLPADDPFAGVDEVVEAPILYADGTRANVSCTLESADHCTLLLVRHVGAMHTLDEDEDEDEDDDPAAPDLYNGRVVRSLGKRHRVPRVWVKTYIRQLKERNDWTDVDLAKRINCSKATIGRLRRGDIEDVRETTYVALRALLVHQELIRK